MNTGLQLQTCTRLPVRSIRTLLGLLSVALLSGLTGGCAPEENANSPEVTSNAVVVEWGEIAFDAALAHDGFEDFAVNLRGMTMMHLAVHDALNSIMPSYARYALAGPMQRLAHPSAAAAQAARDVLVDIYPAQQETFDSALTTYLARVSDGEGKTLGIELGKEAAGAILSERSGDRWDMTGSYVPDSPPKAGDYQFVPPFDFVFRPDFGDAEPFGIESGTQFRSGPPPDLASSDYTTAYDEVKALGARYHSSRSEDQSHEAAWWYEFAEIGWNRIANQLVRQRGVALYPAARLFALVNMGLSDAYVAIWNAKRHYDRWRPYTAIRAGDTDGNAETDADRDWEPSCITPPTWEYPSAHAMQSASAAEMLAAALGTDDIAFTATSTTAPEERPARSFTRLRAAAAEAADSRVLCGIHFRFATDAGLREGQALARSILGQHLRPMGDSDHAD